MINTGSKKRKKRLLELLKWVFCDQGLSRFIVVVSCYD